MGDVNDEDDPLAPALMDHLMLKTVIKHQHLSLGPGQVPLNIDILKQWLSYMRLNHLVHSEHWSRITWHLEGEVSSQLGVGQPIVRIEMGSSYKYTKCVYRNVSNQF